MFERSVKMVVTVTLPLAVAAAVLADPIVDLLYGDGFPAAADALRYLSVTIALYPITYVANYLFLSQHRQGALVKIYAVVAVTNVALNFVLIPRMSLLGAALATSLSEVLATGLLVAFAGSCEHIGWFRAIRTPVLAATLAALGMALTRDSLVVAVIVGALGYAAVIGTESWLGRDDLLLNLRRSQ